MVVKSQGIFPKMALNQAKDIYNKFPDEWFENPNYGYIWPTRVSMEVSKLVNHLFPDLHPNCIGVMIHLLSTMDIPGYIHRHLAVMYLKLWSCFSNVFSTEK